MNKIVELPIIEPIYSTYHDQGSGAAILKSNESIRNWYLNQSLILTCNRKFLQGFTTPEIKIVNSAWFSNPHLDRKDYSAKFLKQYIHPVIKNMLDQGYYVYYSGIDDYYLEGKTWYKNRHFSHDGLICGYNQNDHTYCIYAYDNNWIYNKFWVSRKSFEEGRKAMNEKSVYGVICAIKPKPDKIAFSSNIALKKISEYLDSSIEQYPENEDGAVFGIAVHDFIAKYVDKLIDESIPYEKMDRRIFRLIWEHKKVMLERIKLIEDALSLDHFLSDAYTSVVREADNCRMLYAAHHMKQRNSVLPTIQKKLLSLKLKEKGILEKLIEATKGDDKK